MRLNHDEAADPENKTTTIHSGHATPTMTIHPRNDNGLTNNQQEKEAQVAGADTSVSLLMRDLNGGKPVEMPNVNSHVGDQQPRKP